MVAKPGVSLWYVSALLKPQDCVVKAYSEVLRPQACVSRTIFEQADVFDLKSESFVSVFKEEVGQDEGDDDD
jgi:hypothetical protein